MNGFLSRRQQCVRYVGTICSFVDICVGIPQGAKLGPILWFHYVNDLVADGFSFVKYADGTTFYMPAQDLTTQSVAPAIVATEEGSTSNSMLLDPDMTVVMDISLKAGSIRTRLVNDINFFSSTTGPILPLKSSIWYFLS